MSPHPDPYAHLDPRQHALAAALDPADQSDHSTFVRDVAEGIRSKRTIADRQRDAETARDNADEA